MCTYLEIQTQTEMTLCAHVQSLQSYTLCKKNKTVLQNNNIYYWCRIIIL